MKMSTTLTQEINMSFQKIERIQSSESSVIKYVYTKDDAVAESVLYKYPDYLTRTVICCSTQSGCNVGCRFCGAGDYFVRSLTTEEIVEQVDHSLKETEVDASKINKLQIMFMSMGEPLLNLKNLIPALRILYQKYPNARLLISTIGPRVNFEEVINISKEVPAIGLQFSVHKSTDKERNKLIPFKNKLTLEEISSTGERWYSATLRKPFFNYCASDDNSSDEDANRLAELFSPSIWEATISVICERNEGLPTRNQHQRDLATDFSGKLLNRGFNVRVFDPAGQDDVGGGCGQLWFVQNWFKENPDKTHKTIGFGLPVIHCPENICTK